LDAKNMLELSLRDEFRSAHLRGTVVSLTDNNSTGATQVAAQDFLEITYPTLDVLKALEAIGPGRGRPVVVMGERGQGKSHILAVMHMLSGTRPRSRDGWRSGRATSNRRL
jgi:transcriptional regulator with AAA-type ATPase domain